MTMIVRTRYRDVPFEEASQCCADISPSARAIWEVQRGQPIDIIVPCDGAPSLPGHFTCKGPLYRVVGERFSVCPHQAEIGD